MVMRQLVPQVPMVPRQPVQKARMEKTLMDLRAMQQQDLTTLVQTPSSQSGRQDLRPMMEQMERKAPMPTYPLTQRVRLQKFLWEQKALTERKQQDPMTLVRLEQRALQDYSRGCWVWKVSMVLASTVSQLGQQSSDHHGHVRSSRDPVCLRPFLVWHPIVPLEQRPFRFGSRRARTAGG